MHHTHRHTTIPVTYTSYVTRESLSASRVAEGHTRHVTLIAAIDAASVDAICYALHVDAFTLFYHASAIYVERHAADILHYAITLFATGRRHAAFITPRYHCLRYAAAAAAACCYAAAELRLMLMLPLLDYADSMLFAATPLATLFRR